MKGVFAALLTLLPIAIPHSADARLSLPNIAKHREVNAVALTADGSLPAKATGPLEVHFQAYRRSFHLILRPSTIIDEDSRTYVVDDEGYHQVETVNRSYVGTVLGEENSRVRLTLTGGAFVGTIRIGLKVYAVEPRSRYDRGAGEGSIVVYRAVDNPVESNPEGPSTYKGMNSHDDHGSEESAPSGAAAGVPTAESLYNASAAAGSADLPEDRRPRMALIDGELRRHSVGLIADRLFYENYNLEC